MAMSPIKRGSGLNKSEQYLARLSDRTFLDLWSYPNVHVSRIVNRKASSRELCDILVVCGDHIIVFSDKTIAWPGGKTVESQWARWYRRAVEGAVDQIRGAQRIIETQPERIFLDPKCNQPFPIELPPAERRKIHGVVVARGAGDACRNHFGSGSGSLVLKPDSDPNAAFTIGDVDPAGAFVHVMDDVTLDILMRELDTITDLTDYLQKKEQLIRGGRLSMAAGEEDLLAYYLTHMESANTHGFPHPDGRSWRPGDALVIEAARYVELARHPRYQAMKAANEVSYLWDRLITMFTKSLREGTAVVVDDKGYSLREFERGVRHMAMETRFHRRLLSAAILEAIEKGQREQRFTRAIVPNPDTPNNGSAYFFMMLAYPDHIPLAGGYEQYRRTRRDMMQAYAMCLMSRQRFLKRVIGIGMEPPPDVTGREEMSEDLLMLEPGEWTTELAAEAERLSKEFDIFQEGRVQEGAISDDEFPAVETITLIAGPALNQKQRRAQTARRLKEAARRSNK